MAYINPIIDLERCKVRLRKVPARKAQALIGFIQGCGDPEVLQQRIFGTPEGIALTDILLDYMDIVIGDGTLPLTDKNLEDLDITGVDLILLKVKALENIQGIVKNENAQNILNSMQPN